VATMLLVLVSYFKDKKEFLKGRRPYYFP